MQKLLLTLHTFLKVIHHLFFYFIYLFYLLLGEEFTIIESSLLLRWKCMYRLLQSDGFHISVVEVIQCLYTDGFVQIHHRLFAPFYQPECLIGGYPIEPCREGMVFFVLPDTSEYPHKRVLCSILGIIMAYHQSADMPVERLFKISSEWLLSLGRLW